MRNYNINAYIYFPVYLIVILNKWLQTIGFEQNKCDTVYLSVNNKEIILEGFYKPMIFSYIMFYIL